MESATATVVNLRMTPNVLGVVATCPECAAEKRSVEFSRAVLTELLDKDANIQVAFIICGHTRSLSVEEKNKLRKVLAELDLWNNGRPAPDLDA